LLAAADNDVEVRATGRLALVLDQHANVLRVGNVDELFIHDAFAIDLAIPGTKRKVEKA